jgi:hypothetical protein
MLLVAWYYALLAPSMPGRRAYEGKEEQIRITRTLRVPDGRLLPTACAYRNPKPFCKEMTSYTRPPVLRRLPVRAGFGRCPGDQVWHLPMLKALRAGLPCWGCAPTIRLTLRRRRAQASPAARR